VGVLALRPQLDLFVEIRPAGPVLGQETLGDDQGAHARGDQVADRLLGGSSRTHDAHRGAQEAQLSILADLIQEDVPSVALRLWCRELQASAPSDRRDDLKLSTVTKLSLKIVEEPDVFLVGVDVDETAQVTLGVTDLCLDSGMGLLETIERLTDALPRHCDLIMATDKAT